MKKNTKVAVTGANGFIGSKLVKKLLNKNIQVLCLQRNNINKMNMNTHYFNLRNLNNDTLSILSNVDVVVHTAGLVHQGKLSEKKYLNLNFEATKKIFEKCKELKIKKFIFLSTMSVYGLTSSSSKININSLVNPTTNYAKSKFLTERYLLSQKSNIKVSIIRLPSVYGKKAPGNFGDLEKLALTRLPLPFLGLKNKRSMINVDLVADFLAKIALNYSDSLGLHLLCEETPFSTEFFFKKIRNENNIPERLFFLPKNLIRIFLKLIRKEKTYRRLYENLEFISTINLKNNKS